MGKVKVSIPPFVSPVCLVGALVDQKPNFMAIAWWTFIESRGMKVAVVSEKQHYTNRGIHENNCFSINIASTSMTVKTDFCGLYSGSKVDKSGVFEVFYGELKKAPMISESPVTMECKLVRAVEFDHNDLLIGEVVGAYAEESCLTGNRGNIVKVDPLLFEGGNPPLYWKVGGQVANAYQVGKDFKPKS